MPVVELNLMRKSPLHTGATPPTDDAFARREWFDMLRQYCFADETCLWPSATQGNVSATLPLIERSDGLSGLSNYYSFSYAPIFEGTPDIAQKQALIREIAAGLRRQHHRASFYPLLNHDGTADMLRRAFAAAGWIALLTDQGVNYVLNVDGRDFATYWAGRPGALRSSVKRKGRGHPFDFAIYTRMTEPLWQAYMTVYGASWKNAEPYPQMIRAMADEAAARGALRLGVARLGDTVVAMQIWTIEGSVACIHKLAHDGAYDKMSPGTLLSHYLFEQMIDREKVRLIDYGTGNNAYKQDWMDEKRPMMRLDCFDPRKAATWLPALRTRISQLVHRPA